MKPLFFRVYGNNLSIFNFLGKSFFIPCVCAVDGLGAAHLKGIVADQIWKLIFDRLPNSWSFKGLELAPLMKNQTTGRPRKDPATG